jgi:hypothetical protein
MLQLLWLLWLLSEVLAGMVSYLYEEAFVEQQRSAHVAPNILQTSVPKAFW